MTLKAAQVPQNPTSREVTPEGGDGDKDKKPNILHRFFHFIEEKTE